MVKNSLLLALAWCAPAGAWSEPATATAPPRIIDDLKLRQVLNDGLGKLADGKGVPDGKALQQAVRKAPAKFTVDLSAGAGKTGSYEEIIPSVGVLGSVYKCDKCSKWHLGGTSSAWCLSADGVFVTNFHCFEKAQGSAMGVSLLDGRVAAVRAILAADRTADVCLFRVEGKDFRPLAVGEPAAVGSKVRVISHPEGRFFFQTTGEVARYYLRPGRQGEPASNWMSITADYAKGSSGGPVCDEKGRVVGMVSSTQSIYYESSGKEPKGPLQMVVKSCVPVAAIRRVAGGG